MICETFAASTFALNWSQNRSQSVGRYGSELGDGKFWQLGVDVFLLFAHGCDVTSMSLVGSLMALTHSLDSD